MNRSTTKILLLLAIFTVAITQIPVKKIKEDTKYRTDLKLKQKSFYAFDVSSAIDFTAADKSKLVVTTNWGSIKTESKTTSINLPDDFKASVILRFDTANGFLNVVGFNRKDKKCVIALLYDEVTFRTLTFSTLSRSECNRVRVSRFGEGTDKRMISYITQDGTFKWIARRNEGDTASTWNTVNKNFFKDGVLDPDEFHDVQMVTSEINSRDLFIVYQKSRGVKSSKFFGYIGFLYSSSSGFGSLSSTSTLTFTYSSEGLNRLAGHLKSDFLINRLNVRTMYKRTKWSGVWMTFKQRGTGISRTAYLDLDSELLRRRSNQPNPRYLSFGNENQFYGTSNTKNQGFKHYSEFEQNGTLRMCETEKNYFGGMTSQSYFKKSCVAKKIAEHQIGNDEFVEDITVTNNLIAVVTVRTKGDEEEKRQFIYDLNDVGTDHIDTDHNYYAANEDYLFEIKIAIGASDQPTINIKAGSSKVSKYYLMPGTAARPPVGPYVQVTDGTETVKHVIKASFVDLFEKEMILETDLFINVKDFEKGKTITGDDKIKMRADWVKSYDETAKEQFFYLTPFKMLDDTSEYVKAPEPKEENLNQQPTPIIMPKLVRKVCELNKFILFTDKPDSLAFFAPKYTRNGNTKHMLIKILPGQIPFTQFRCESANDINLFIGKGTTKNTYSVISFNEDGEYLVRQFYSEIDLMGVQSFTYNKYRKRYRLFFQSGKQGLLDFRNLFPVYNVKDTTGGTLNVQGLSKSFTFSFNYKTSTEQMKKIMDLD